MALVLATTLRESITNIAAAMCVVWEADADTPAVYAEHCRVHNADLEHSLLAYLPDGQFVGVGVLCRRGRRGFVLDFGIAPPFRGQGFGHELFKALLVQARQAGLEALSLIVSARNQPARQIYRAAGFERVRELATLHGKAPAAEPGSAHEIRTDLSHAILAWSGPEITGVPHWEREVPSLLAYAGTRAFETPQAFLLARRSAYERQTDIVQLGLGPGATPEEVCGLLAAASDAFNPTLPLALPEEPVGSRAYNLLVTCADFRPAARAYEMQLQL